MTHFHYYTKQEILDQTRLRKYETKVGERVHVVSSPSSSVDANTLFDASPKYVCFGIPESIGVLGNYGTKGTENTWFHFVKSFLNLQSTDHCNGDEIILAGYFDFSSIAQMIDKNSYSSIEKVDACRHAVANIIDEEVEAFIKTIVSSGKIPIVIGGGQTMHIPSSKALPNLYTSQK